MPPSPDCPYCGGATRPHVSARDINRRISDIRYFLRRCTRCGLFFVANQPDDIGKYYHDPTSIVPVNRHALDGVLADHRHKIEILTRYCKGGELLEIGPSIGVFCVLAQQAGFQVSAIEASVACTRFLSEELGVRSVESTDPAAVMAHEDRSYDAICLWHSLEHLPRPWEVIERAARRLNPSGVLVVAVPNPLSRQARIMGARWPHWDLPRHLFEFPPDWLRAVGTACGLEWASTTTCDRGSLRVHASSWGMALQSLLISERLRPFGARLAHLLTRWLLQWPPAESRGAAYTIVWRRPAVPGVPAVPPPGGR
jgi:SAM-dependent methyltransferase